MLQLTTVTNTLSHIQQTLVGFREFCNVESGESGNAWFAIDENGQRVVVKVADGTVDHVLSQHALVGSLRDRNYPAPTFLPPVETSVGVITIQRAVDGQPSEILDHQFAESMLALNELHKDVHPQGFAPFKNTLLESLEYGFEEYCVHDALRNHSDEASDHLDWMQAVGRESVDVKVTDADAVHYDFHHLNVLRTPENEPSCVIDWEGCRSGDRNFDIVTLAIDAWPYTKPDVLEHLRTYLLMHISPDALRLFGAHMLLRLLDWNIRKHPTDRIESRMRTTREWRTWLDGL